MLLKKYFSWIVDFLDLVDSEVPAKSIKIYRKKSWIIILTSLLSLYLFYYLKNYSSLKILLKWLDNIFCMNLFFIFENSYYRELLSYVWWSFWNVALFLLIPIFIIKTIFKEPVSYYGWQIGDTFKHLGLYLFIVCFFIIFIWIYTRFDSSFLYYYPFYKKAGRSLFDFLAWEFLYILQFVALEFFFRGFLLQGLKRVVGSLSIAIMLLPYMMIHLPKMWTEALASIPFGLMLGFLALKSKSIWGGVAIHLSVAITLDVLSILK